MILSLVGTADSSYLLWKHLRSTALATGGAGSAFCPAGGCDLVNEGQYAEIRGVPVAAVGLAGYLALFVLSVMAVTVGGRAIAVAIIAVSGIGVAVSAFLTYLQIAVIRAVCPWCILSALTMASIFLSSVVVLCKAMSLEQPGVAKRR